MKIAIGLSGGIDSAAALIRLLDAGHDVVGITMKNNEGEDEYGKCCSLRDINDARRLCTKYKVPHYLIDVKAEFERDIIQYFIKEYQRGRTPNPCLFCNPLMKFKYLVEAAKGLGYETFATGHYARLSQNENGRITLRSGKDQRKDQSYFLSQLSPETLKSVIFPLAETTKDENLALLEENHIPIARKVESQEICFVPGNDYRKFLEGRFPEGFDKGEFITPDGKKVGEHKGLPNYTIGQRKGLGLSMQLPVYVREIRPETNQVVIGEKIYSQRFIADQPNWIWPIEEWEGKTVKVKVRYRHDGVPGKVSQLNEKEVEVQLLEPTSSITPGQGAVFYEEEDTVLGSAIIDQVIES